MFPMTRIDLRSELLADTILGTDTAFDLIDEIAAIPGVKWSHAPCIGLRGRIPDFPEQCVGKDGL